MIRKLTGFIKQTRSQVQILDFEILDLNIDDRLSFSSIFNYQSDEMF